MILLLIDKLLKVLCFKNTFTMVTVDRCIKCAVDYLQCDFELRLFQSDVIKSYIEQKDVFAIAGTGAGKSMTYISYVPFVFDIQNGRDDTAIVKEPVTWLCLIIQPQSHYYERSAQETFKFI